MIKHLLSACLLAFALAGCVTAQNPLGQREIEALHLVTVNVNTDDATTLWWGDADRAFARSKGLPDSESENLSKTPEGRAFVAKLAAAKISTALENQLKPILIGQRPVRVVVHLRRLFVASAIQRVIAGGHHELEADVTIVDAKTGATVLAYPAFRAMALAGQGIGGTLIDAAMMPDPIERLVQNFAAKYREWLQPPQGA